MQAMIGKAGHLAALVGILICLVSGAARVSGAHHLLGFEAMTLFNVGIAVMVFACLVKLHALSPGRE